MIIATEYGGHPFVFLGLHIHVSWVSKVSTSLKVAPMLYSTKCN